ncbi:MAG: phospholipid carrier-dependent glycosyltransferase [Chloroflexota bacterium]
MVQPLKGEIFTGKHRRRALALSVGLLLFTVYLFVYRGGFHSIDEVSIFAVTESLVKFGRANTDQIAWTQWTTSQAEAQGFFGRDGHVYSKKGLALSLAQAPLYWLALQLPGLGMLQTVSLLNAFITAATGMLIFMFSGRLGYTKNTAVSVALIYGLATIAFVYAKYLFSEPLAGLLLLLAAYMLFTYRQEGGLRHVAMAGLSAGFAVMTRANNLFLLPVFGLYLLWVIYTSARQQLTPNPLPALRSSLSASRSPLLTFLCALAIPGLILLAYNASRSGNPLQTGYDLTLFSPNILLGLYKLLFSPLRGLFIYSPILLLSLPGWWLLRQAYPAEAWLFAGLAGVTVGLFSAWSSGEGLSWGSRFLVSVTPFLTIPLAPLVEHVTSNRVAGSRVTHNALPAALYTLLLLSLLIQILGVVINPWVFLAQIQAKFGGEFFLENTAALYNFGYSQIAGQLQAWSGQNSDLAWWQPSGFDGLAFGLGLALVILSAWLLGQQLTADGSTELAEVRRPPTADRHATLHTPRSTRHAPLFIPYSLLPTPYFTYLLTLPLTIIVAAFLLSRYYPTDRQFGPLDDPYTQALNAVTAQAQPNDQIVTIAQNHYHVPMNRFRTRLPLIGMAQQAWPPPDPAQSLLAAAISGPNTWLITVGFTPAAPDNAAEQWLAGHAYKAADEWLDDVRLIRYGNLPPTDTRPLDLALGQEIKLLLARLTVAPQTGQVLPVEFVWQPLGQPAEDYNLFLQLLEAEGKPLAQHDGPPCGGYAPTSTWLPGQQIVDRHGLALPPDLPPGAYRLIAGLYNPATGARLATGDGRDFVDLALITLAAPTDETAP